MGISDRLLGVALLFCALGPVLLLILYCCLTGRLRWLFTYRHGAEPGAKTPPVVAFLAKLALWLFPVYLVLLGVFAYRGAQ